MLTNAHRSMLEARETVARANVFYGRLCYMGDIIEDDTIPTASTDGIHIYYNPKFINALPERQICGVFLHEVLHKAMNHVGRREHRDAELWNVACDFAINQIVLHSYFSLPMGALIDNKYTGKTAEKIYRLLQESQDPHDKNLKAPSTMKEPASQEESEKAERKMRRAITVGKDKCKKTSDTRRLIKEFENAYGDDTASKINWRDLVRTMILNARSKEVGDWARPNRRYLSQDLYMAGAQMNIINKAIICFDTSGSMWKEETLKEMQKEAVALLEEELVKEIQLIAVDTDVRNEIIATTAQDIYDFKMIGNGCTDFRSVMEHIHGQENISALIFFTDMETLSFGSDPGYPTIWVNWATSTRKPSFGNVTQFSAA